MSALGLNLNNKPPFPRVIDNTMRAEFVMCPRAFWWRFLHGLVVKGVSIHLHTGSVVAIGLEHVRKRVYGDGLDLDTALTETFRVMAHAWNRVESDHIKNFVSSFESVDYYFQKYEPLSDNIKPLMDNGKPAVEFNFILPIDVKHPETGEPILVSGRFDMLGVQNGERKVILDEKTCMQLGAQWGKKWKLRSQFSTYTWGAQQYGHKVDTTIVRGICFRRNGTFDSAEAVVFRPPWHVDMWYEQLIRDVKRMVQSWESNTWDMNLGETCTLYGGCPYQLLCLTPKPEEWLGSYEVRKWDPTVRPIAPPGTSFIQSTGEDDDD